LTGVFVLLLEFDASPKAQMGEKDICGEDYRRYSRLKTTNRFTVR
jgi:hypothetical protein